MFSKIIERIENSPVTFAGWLFGFLGILFIRFLLENISSPSLSGYLGTDAPILIHYYLFYLVAAISWIVVVGIFVGDRLKVSRLALFGFLFTWLAPLIDLVISRGSGYVMAYLFEAPAALLRSFVTFFAVQNNIFSYGGITIGIRIELFIILCLTFFYVLYKTRSLINGLLSALLYYAVIFFWLSFPSLIYAAVCLFSGSACASGGVLSFFIYNLSSSLIFKNFLHPSTGLSYLHGIEVFFSVSLSEIYYLIGFLLAALWFYLVKRNKFFAALKNSRPERVMHYFLMVALGMLLGGLSRNVAAFSWLNVVYFLVLFLSYYCAWMFAVSVNDLVDKNSDAISNANRPLVSGSLSDTDVKNLSLFFLAWSILGGFLSGNYILFFLLAFTASYYIYSAPPTRLKRVPILSTFMIALATLSAALSGFYAVSEEKTLAAFPLRYIVLILLAVTLGAVFKDIKDIEGDKAEGLKTLPVIFGEKNGKRVVGLLLGIAFLLVPAILWRRVLFWPSVAFGVAAYFLINAKTYRERFVFVLYFLYIAITALLLLG
jgi:4-hydroxybenzoate polyprenyltransferase